MVAKCYILSGCLQQLCAGQFPFLLLQNKPSYMFRAQLQSYCQKLLVAMFIDQATGTVWSQ